MAIIGIFNATDNGYEGRIETLSLKGEVSIERSSKKNDNQPDYRVFHRGQDFKSDIGAAWKKTSRDGAQYLSVSLDDPALPGKLFCRLVKTGSERGHTLYWERPRPRDEEE